MPLATGLAAAALLGLLTLLATARHGRRRPRSDLHGSDLHGSDLHASDLHASDAHGSDDEHPESLTTVLGPGDEEYLAWLADHHWPGDEYLDLEHDWLEEMAFGEPAGHYEAPLCPRCGLRREDVWPCPACGRILHSSCGHGMRRRAVERPYRTHGTNPEAVIAEWICTGCTAVVGLDVDHGGEPDAGDGAGDIVR